MLKDDNKSCRQPPVCINRRQREFSRFYPANTLACLLFSAVCTVYPTARNSEKYLLPKVFSSPALFYELQIKWLLNSTFCISFATLKTRITFFFFSQSGINSALPLLQSCEEWKHLTNISPVVFCSISKIVIFAEFTQIFPKFDKYIKKTLWKRVSPQCSPPSRS